MKIKSNRAEKQSRKSLELSKSAVKQLRVKTAIKAGAKEGSV
jgi:hypothetical protein